MCLIIINYKQDYYIYIITGPLRYFTIYGQSKAQIPSRQLPLTAVLQGRKRGFQKNY